MVEQIEWSVDTRNWNWLLKEKLEDDYIIWARVGRYRIATAITGFELERCWVSNYIFYRAIVLQRQLLTGLFVAGGER